LFLQGCSYTYELGEKAHPLKEGLEKKAGIDLWSFVADKKVLIEMGSYP